MLTLSDKSTLIERSAAETALPKDIRQNISLKEIDDLRAALDASDLRYRRLFETVKEGILILNAETGMVIDVNPFLITMLGFSHEQFLGKPIWELGLFKEILANKDSFAELIAKEYIRYENLPMETFDAKRIEVEFISSIYSVGGVKVIQCNVRDMTGHRQVEAMAAQLVAIVESSGDAIIGKNLDGIVTSWNEGAEKVFGYPAEEMVGQPIMKLIPPERQHEEIEILARVRRGESVQDFDTVRLRKNGSTIDISVTTSAVKNATGKIIGASKVARDISERKLAEAEIHHLNTELEQRVIERTAQSERRFREMLENVTLIAMTLDKDGMITFCNDYLLRLTGWKREEIIGTDWFATFIPEADITVKKVFFETIANGHIQPHFENPIKTRGGALRDIVWNNTTLRDPAGNIVGSASIGEDVTARKQAQKELASNQMLLKAILETLPIGVWFVNSGGQIQLANPADGALWAGLRKPDLDTMADYKTWWVGMIERIRQENWAFSRAVSERTTTLHELREIVCWDGTRRSILHSAIPLEDLNHQIQGAIAINEDVTERKRADEELRFRNAILSTQQEASIDGILVVNEDARIVSYNSRFVEMWNVPQELLATRDDAPLLKFVASKLEDPSAFIQRVQYLYEHRRETSREEVNLKDGRVFDRYSAPMFGADEHFYGRVWYFRDITDRKQLESQFRQSQKMEAIGQLAGGVAHDFNNILAAIMMQAELSGMVKNVPAEVREGVQQIQAYAERAANLIRQLLLFSRRQVMQPRELDLNEVITSLVKMLQRLIGEDVRIKLHLHPGPLITRADAGMLDQVLMNLAVNARDAMPAGGSLTIESAIRLVDDDFARTCPEAVPGRYVWLSVSDTGGGIPPEVLPRIFEPFFTTKAPGIGTGLGLATVFGIVRQHKGWLKVCSEPGQGANFQIFLPASDASHELLAADATQATPRGGTETILLVEDDVSVRRLTRVVLERAGYVVLEAAHGVEAIRIWELESGRIDLLLTDVVMPEGLSGRELAGQLQIRQPKLKVIFTSGYSADIAGLELSLQEAQNFIQKPGSPQRILESVRRCLDD